MADLHALARELGATVRETPEYAAVREARAKVEAHEAARIMLADFRRRERKYRQAVLAGQSQEEQAKDLQNLAEIVGLNPYLRELITAETVLARMMVGLQEEIVTAAGLAEEAEEKEDEGAKDSARG